jgi:hypothetical protein
MQSDTKGAGLKPDKFRVERFVNPTAQTVVFRVTGTTQDGKRIRENFKDKDAADRRQAALYALEKGLELLPTQKSILTPAQLKDAERAIAGPDGRRAGRAGESFVGCRGFDGDVDRVNQEFVFRQWEAGDVIELIGQDVPGVAVAKLTMPRQSVELATQLAEFKRIISGSLEET